MRSELFRIPFEVAGVPIFGVGVLLALWLVAVGVIAWRTLRRPGGQAEMLGLAPVLAIFAAVIVGLPQIFEEGLPIRGYGVMLLLAASTGLAMAIHRGRQQGLHPDTIFSLAFAMFICGIVGARLFHVIEYWENFFVGQPIGKGLAQAVLFTEGGLVVYGSLIGAGAAFLWFTRRHKLPTLALADLLAPSLAIGLALGRIGCLLNGCCYGGVCDRPWAVTFPRQSTAERMSPPYQDQLAGGEMHGFRWEQDPRDGRLVVTRVADDLAPKLTAGAVIEKFAGQRIESADQLVRSIFAAYKTKQPLKLGLADGSTVVLAAAPIRPRSLPVHPTQIYSAVNACLLGWFLWLYYPLRRRDGEVTALLLTLYPIARFLLEMIRTDESAIFGTGLSISQNVSIVILLAMLVFWFYLLRRPAERLDKFAVG